jgi:hypothetical protein
LTRIKTKKANLCKGRNINKVIVRNKLTADGKKFLISDNNKKNRIIVFASPTGLKMLSESKKIHMDGTFHTKASTLDNYVFYMHHLVRKNMKIMMKFG